MTSGRLKESTSLAESRDTPRLTCLERFQTPIGIIVFYDAKIQLGQRGVNQTEEPLRLVGCRADGKKYWVATDRFDLTAEQIAQIYKLHWDIEKFFACWKRHLRVYHLISRKEHGLMIQILAGLIAYLLLAIYCHEQHGEAVSIKKVRELRCQILNETREAELEFYDPRAGDNPPSQNLFANS